MAENFSPSQLKSFKAYVRVQNSGRFNMFDPKAQRASGLSNDDYFFVLENYSALRAASESKSKKEPAEFITDDMLDDIDELR